MKYAVDLPSLSRDFPEGFEVSSLLLDFGNWLQTKPGGSVGYFGIKSERINDHWIEHGADLHSNFAFFIRDPTGGQIGYWLYNGKTTAAPPIVLVGSEGELTILSETLEEFLVKLADGETQAPDLDSRESTGNEVAALRRWLKPKLDRTPALSKETHPDLSKWMDKWGRKQRKLIDAEPCYVQIADRLRSYVKPKAEAWETANFDVFLVGSHFEMYRAGESKPMPQKEVADLEPLFRSARRQRLQVIPERGAWLSAWLRIGTKGGATLCCNFMDRPARFDRKIDIPKNDYKRDLSEFPRSKHWMPNWMD